MPRLLILLLACGPLGCGFAHVNEDHAARPERAMGTGATIMMPGDSPPPLSGYDPYAAPGSSSSSGESNGPQSYGGGGTQTSHNGPGSSTGSSSGTAPRGPEMTMIGGSSGEADTEQTLRDMPLGPLAVLFGYPFWIFGKTLPEEADEAAEERSMPDPEPELVERSRHPQDVAQRSQTERENAELAEQLRRQAPPAPLHASASGSIHDELAALERSLGRGPSVPGVQPRHSADRNADGHPDLWTKTAPDGTQREALDENGDGRVDRINSYDADHRLIRSEEDRDGDGRLETVSLFENGEIRRRQSDDNGDGRTDSWTFFHGGEMVRHEVDRDANGMKDLSLVYDAGELVREEEDRNADGRPDLISHYRNGEVVERAEDTDFDGRTDIRSFYEHGRLVKREVS
jgi:hypothetical protein